MNRAPREIRLVPPEEVRLDRFTKEESFDLAREMRPDLTWEEFEAAWNNHCAWKDARQLN